MEDWKGIEKDFEPEDDQLGFIYLMTIENPDTKKPAIAGLIYYC